MDTNLSYQPTPTVGATICVEGSGNVEAEGIYWVGKVIHVFPKGEEIPEALVRKYFKPKPGTKFAHKPWLLAKPSLYDRVVLEIAPGHNMIYPHQRFYAYEVIHAPENKS